MKKIDEIMHTIPFNRDIADAPHDQDIGINPDEDNFAREMSMKAREKFIECQCIVKQGSEIVASGYLSIDYFNASGGPGPYILPELRKENWNLDDFKKICESNRPFPFIGERGYVFHSDKNKKIIFNFLKNDKDIRMILHFQVFSIEDYGRLNQVLIQCGIDTDDYESMNENISFPAGYLNRDGADSIRKKLPNIQPGDQVALKYDPDIHIGTCRDIVGSSGLTCHVIPKESDNPAMIPGCSSIFHFRSKQIDENGQEYWNVARNILVKYEDNVNERTELDMSNMEFRNDFTSEPDPDRTCGICYSYVEPNDDFVSSRGELFHKECMLSKRSNNQLQLRTESRDETYERFNELLEIEQKDLDFGENNETYEDRLNREFENLLQDDTSSFDWRNVK